MRRNIGSTPSCLLNALQLHSLCVDAAGDNPYVRTMTTRLYTHPIFLEHVTPPGHPERPDRLRAIARALDDEAFDRLDRVEAPRGDEGAILLAHPKDYVEHVRAAIPETGIARIDADTSASPKSWEAALTAIGAATAAVDDVFEGRADNVFVAARPPGHHAEHDRAMGCCLFNNAAIAARHAQKKHGVERVAIVDFDVHHGNGTQDIFWSDPTVLYASTHQMPLYPGTGAMGETGAGNIVNAPLSPGSGSDSFREAFSDRVLAAVEAFGPELVIVSAGFDAHHRDPLAEINLTEDDFDWATGKLLEQAGRSASNRLVSLLEGGYDLQGLAFSTASHVKRLMEG
jgi:acetoin utilization deacetylase AcuC-like enzyme